jgi:hypothetical protein
MDGMPLDPFTCDDPFTEDETDAVVITHRAEHDNGDRTSLAQVLDTYGLTEADLRTEREHELRVIAGLENILDLDASLTIAERDQISAQIAEHKRERLVCLHHRCGVRVRGAETYIAFGSRCDDHR